MARRFKPIQLKLISGSRRIPNAPEPEAPGALAEPPAWLSPGQREQWAYAVANAPPSLWRRLDASILAIWAVAADLHQQASMKVAEVGMLIRAPDSGLPMQSPYLPIVNKQAQIMLKAAALLGIGPASRAGIAAGPRTNSFSNNGRRPPPDPAA
jgi:phage terminase small subunit